MKALFSLFIVCISALSFPASLAAQPPPPPPVDLTIQTCEDRASKTLAIKQEPQEPAVSWCWAAATANVIDYVYYRHQNPLIDPAPEQCKMAGLMSPGATCCPPTPEVKSQYDCNQTHWPEQIMDKLGFTYSPLLKLVGTKRDPSTFPRLKWSQVVKEICDGRPYISVIGPSEDNTHAVVVHGFHQTTSKLGSTFIFSAAVKTYDPQADDSYADYGRYSRQSPSPAEIGDPTGVNQHGDQHFGDTHNIRKAVIPMFQPDR